MVEVKNTNRGWEVRIDGRLWGTYPTEAEATKNAPASGINWN